MTALAVSPDCPLLLMGCGRMGQVLLRGWLADGLERTAVLVVDPALPDLGRVPVRGHLPAALPEPAIVLLAVKPQIMADVVQTLPRWPEALHISIAAGLTLNFFEDHLGPVPLVRAMPNTPAAIGQGISVCVGNRAATAAHRVAAERLMAAAGPVAWIDDEHQMDAVTAVSGSGPAYVFHLVEALAAAGEAEGLPPELAMQLARQTVVGAGALLGDSADSAAVLRAAVTSPGGTTAAALEVLQAGGALTQLMTQAVRAAAKRAKALCG